MSDFKTMILRSDLISRAQIQLRKEQLPLVAEEKFFLVLCAISQGRKIISFKAGFFKITF